MPKLICICGPNGSGKSTLSRSLAIRENILVIDPDQLSAEGLSPISAGKAAIQMARLFLNEGISFVKESTLTAHFDFTLMAEAKRRGYTVELIYIKLVSPELALKRVAARVARGGHDVPVRDILRRFKRSLENLPRATELADRVTILDNSTQNYIRL